MTSGGAETLSQMQAQGISYPLYDLIGAISSITYAPLINTLLAFGEEIGWRGFLYPQLKARMGRKKGWLLGGIIWGAWHWPLIRLIGYEYGAAGNPKGYVGFPVSGMLLFCVITAGWGIFTIGCMSKVEVSGYHLCCMARSMRRRRFLSRRAWPIRVLQDCLVRHQTEL